MTVPSIDAVFLRVAGAVILPVIVRGVAELAGRLVQCALPIFYRGVGCLSAGPPPRREWYPWFSIRPRARKE